MRNLTHARTRAPLYCRTSRCKITGHLIWHLGLPRAVDRCERGIFSVSSKSRNSRRVVEPFSFRFLFSFLHGARLSRSSTIFVSRARRRRRSRRWDSSRFPDRSQRPRKPLNGHAIRSRVPARLRSAVKITRLSRWQAPSLSTAWYPWSRRGSSTDQARTTINKVVMRYARRRCRRRHCCRKSIPYGFDCIDIRYT